MEDWLATHALQAFSALVVALSGGAVGANKRLWRNLKACQKRCRKLQSDLKRAQTDYLQSLEFNFQDRWTIRELAKMVRDYRKQLQLPEEDILLEIYTRAEAETRARRLSASVHITSSPQIEESYSDE